MHWYLQLCVVTGQCEELEAQHGVMAAAACAVENGQVHQSDGSSIDQLRAQLQEQVLPVLCTYRVGQIKRGNLSFLLVAIECIYKVK